MNLKSIFNFFLVVSLVFCASVTNAGTSTNPLPYNSVFELETDDLIKLDNALLEDKIGRKLSFKEKLTLKFVKRKLKRNKDLSGEVAYEEVKTDGMAIAGFVLGILSILGLGILLGIPAIILSAIALKRIRNEPETKSGRGFALAGLILGIVYIAAILVVLAIFAIYML